MQCKECLKRKPTTDFYGNDKMCKVCRLVRVHKYRADNIEAYREYDRARANLPHRVAAREAYQKTPQGIERGNAAKVRWAAASPLKKAASTMVGNAVRDGKLLKPAVCSKCNKPGRIHGHHEDYYKPLDVIWLCAACHRAHHKTMKQRETHETIRTN